MKPLRLLGVFLSGLTKYVLPTMKPCFYSFFNSLSTWQRETFGDSESRPALFPCRHLIKELQEEVLPHLEWAYVGHNAHLLSELADAKILLDEVVWRSGFTAEQWLRACNAKLAENKLRTWQKPNEQGVIEHVRT